MIRRLPLLLALVSVPVLAAEIGELERDGCIRTESARARGSLAYEEVCIRETGAEVEVSRRRPGGRFEVLDRQPRTDSGMSAYLVTAPETRQWLLLESQGKASGSSWALWDLTAGSRILFGRSSNIPYIRDLDEDGVAELVVFDDLLITPTSRWQDEAFGLPRVYRLAETMESRSLRDYPSVVRDFIQQADIAIEAFTRPCIDLPPFDRMTEENCREMAGFAASATRARDFAALFLSGRPPVR
jgi:hypothetical protein